jgi:hypothetical protein
MLGWWKDLDRILRGEATRLSALRRGTIEVPVGGLTVVLIVLAGAYGACMGTFALARGGAGAPWQLLASTVKVPALFLLTLLVTFPSLYVFNALVGSRLALASVLRLLVAALAVTVTVLASLGPIVAFFSVSTTSYPFMKLLNVAVFVVAGLLGMSFLLQTLHRLSVVVPEPEAAAPAPETEGAVPEESIGEPLALGRSRGALEPLDDRMLSRHVKVVFRCWILLFGLVGAQMGWVLRPFVGNPAQPFSFFRPRDSNIFQGIVNALGSLFS